MARSFALKFSRLNLWKFTMCSWTLSKYANFALHNGHSCSLVIAVGSCKEPGGMSGEYSTLTWTGKLVLGIIISCRKRLGGFSVFTLVGLPFSIISCSETILISSSNWAILKCGSISCGGGSTGVLKWKHEMITYRLDLEHALILLR